MMHIFDSGSVRSRISILGTSLVFVVFSTLAMAQEDNAGPTVDPEVFNLFLESRIQRPAAQATEEERTAVMNELTDVYRVTNLPRASELGKDSRVQAQIEMQRRAILFNAVAMDFLASNPATEEEITKAYDTEFAGTPPTEFKARHILVALQSEATDIIKKLDDGADFEELAKSESQGPSGENGGDLGWFAAQAMVKPFSDAVVLLEDGAYSSEPVQTQFGWHIILREDSREGVAAPLESVHDTIKTRIEQQKFQEFISGLR